MISFFVSTIAGSLQSVHSLFLALSPWWLQQTDRANYNNAHLHKIVIYYSENQRKINRKNDQNIYFLMSQFISNLLETWD